MIDMHIHTKNSDGTYTTKEIIKMIQELKIKIFSITDHDNIKSNIEIEKINLPNNTIYIPGIELSAHHKSINCHILGYKIDHKNEYLLKECELIKKRRNKKIIQVLKYIKDNYGIITPEEEKYILEKTKTISRTDICDLLEKKGYGTRKEIYIKYLTPKDLITHRSNSKKIIEVIHKSGGVAVLAHPKEIENDYKIEIEELIKELIKEGLDGIEIYNTIHTEEDVIRYKILAQKYNLITTGGSDFHGTNKPEINLGKTTKNHIIIKQKDINFPY